jgi:hypothetical protein
MCPIDFWDNVELADEYTTNAVLEQMPEMQRSNIVYKTHFPDPTSSGFHEVYFCKADNNGTTYMFSNVDIKYTFDCIDLFKEN